MDFSILTVLLDGRNVAANIHLEIDASRQYVNERMSLLEDYGIVDRVGPNETVGLYEITDEGRAALALRDRYADADDFEALIDAYLSGDLDASELE